MSATTAVPSTQVSSTITTSSESTATTTDQTAPQASGTPYTIIAGDAVLSIARHLCVDSGALAELNGWADGIQHPIYVGDVINIPTGGCPVETAPVVVSETSATTDAPLDALSQLKRDLVGRWEGPAIVPAGWIEIGQVWITFDSDGTYESGGGDNAQPALYYGINCNCPSNTYSVVSLNADGSADLDIDISWSSDGPDTTRGLLHRLTISGDSLTFEFFPAWSGWRGPIRYELHRTS